jgi:hypothetical protein
VRRATGRQTDGRQVPRGTDSGSDRKRLAAGRNAKSAKHNNTSSSSLTTSTCHDDDDDDDDRWFTSMLEGLVG